MCDTLYKSSPYHPNSCILLGINSFRLSFVMHSGALFQLAVHANCQYNVPTSTCSGLRCVVSVDTVYARTHIGAEHEYNVTPTQLIYTWIVHMYAQSAFALQCMSAIWTKWIHEGRRNLKRLGYMLWGYLSVN